jgi:hypothetical protein
MRQQTGVREYFCLRQYGFPSRLSRYIVARQARDLEPKHEADMGERDFGSEPGETRSRDKAGAGEPEVLIDDDDAIGGPAEFTGFVREATQLFKALS